MTRPCSQAESAAVAAHKALHGLRSTFSNWCAEATGFPAEAREMALAHVIRNRAEAAYRRGDQLEKRREIMAAWSEFLNRRA